jgi:ATP-dependent DNA helicase RecQ
VRLVVHWTLPPTPESYYQEAGRAGRDGEFARCVLLWHPRDSSLHRRQLDVTFPPRRTLERLWSGSGKTTGIPANVRSSAERLARELRPDLGAVDWGPVRQRRQRADERLKAMRRYAGGTTCRRRALVGYFGETLAACAGCDRCRIEPAARSLPSAVAARLARLRQALGGKSGPWGSCAARTAAEQALEEWRAAVAREMGVPAYVVLGDRALAQLAAGSTGESHQAPRGAGPRFRAKFDAELRRLLQRLGRASATSPSTPTR